MHSSYLPIKGLQRLFASLLLTGLVPFAQAMNLSPMSDEEMSGVVAKGLIVTDKIAGDELTGSNAYSQPFDFYRMGLDGELELNLNINKLQLGCGGINDQLAGFPGCDVDIDYVGLMGRNGTALGDPKSTFKLLRPYIEIAVRNDDSPNLREIVGIKIGAESADGGLSVGRVYDQAGANQENMIANNCDPSASTGNGVVGCHSGLNTVSGFLGAEMSLSMRIQACLSLLGLQDCQGFFDTGIWLDATGCIGRTAYTGDNCGTGRSDAFFTELAGTRMQGLGLRAAELDLNGDGIVAALEFIGLNDVYAQLEASLRLVHKLTFENTGDFFLSFQREPVAYPRYSKVTPIQEMTANGTINTSFDGCAIATYQTPRCNSAYAVPANTGWWVNFPSVKLLDVENLGDNYLGQLTAGDALQLLGAPGYKIDNAEFALQPADNCYGATQFC